MITFMSDGTEREILERFHLLADETIRICRWSQIARWPIKNVSCLQPRLLVYYGR